MKEYKIASDLSFALAFNGGCDVDIEGKGITNGRNHISKLMEVEQHGHTYKVNIGKLFWLR